MGDYKKYVYRAIPAIQVGAVLERCIIAMPQGAYMSIHAHAILFCFLQKKKHSNGNV